MTRQEHLLTIVAEECAEVAQRVIKALRFGLLEVQDGQPLTNTERLHQELNDLYGILALLDLFEPDPQTMRAKQVKVLKYLEYAKQQGTVLQEAGEP